MRCHDAHEWMSLRLDRRLAPPEEEQLDSHLQSCPACALDWRRWQELDDLLGAAPLAAPPEHLAELVMQRLRGRPRMREVGGSLAVMGLGLVVLAGVVLLPFICWLYLTVPAALGARELLPAVQYLAQHLLAVAATAVEAIRLLLWAALASRSVLVAPAYALLAAAVLAVWLRVAVFGRALAARQAVRP
ncbi:MAG: zf-HC2 domain-containing protein [Anaerolineae bacterium]|nr:zf-HC2 domain-containing protein [Anaerolineae bacterium]